MLNNGCRTKIQSSTESWETDLFDYEFEFAQNLGEFREFAEDSHAWYSWKLHTLRRLMCYNMIIESMKAFFSQRI